MAQSPLATAADYADAMISARRAKQWLFVLLLLMLLAQLAIFFVYKYTNVIDASAAPPVSGATEPAAAGPTTLPMPGEIPTTIPSVEAEIDVEQGRATVYTSTADARDVDALSTLLHYLVTLTDFLAIALAIVLSLVLLLIVNIMVVGRLIGVAKVTSAYIWCLVLAVLLFPWQAFFTDIAYEIPGVLYTWAELAANGKQPAVDTIPATILYWARWVGFPLLAVIILLVVQIKSNRGLKLALGEADVSDDVDTLANT